MSTTYSRICFGYVSVDRDYSFVSFPLVGPNDDNGTTKGAVVANISDVVTGHRFLIVAKPFSKSYLVLEFGRGFIDEGEIAEVHTIGRDDTLKTDFAYYHEALDAVVERLAANSERYAALPHTGGPARFIV